MTANEISIDTSMMRERKRKKKKKRSKFVVQIVHPKWLPEK